MSTVEFSRKTVFQAPVPDSLASSSSNSISPTPDHTPYRSQSSATSLSSLASDSELDAQNSAGNLVNNKYSSDLVDTKLSGQLVNPEAQYGNLVDTYGNDFHIPDFTINDVRAAIPKHCFERSAARGLMYVARDICSLAITFALFHTLWTPANIPSTSVRAAGWALYTFIQGCFGTGLWVMAHECGHQSFSPSKTLNDTVGLICHSALLVPYFSWKISHGKHHKATGHLDRDMVFVPKTREQYASKIGRATHELAELAEETPIVTAGSLIGQQLAGWIIYLSTNITGHNSHTRQKEGRGQGKKNGWGGNVNHFDPSSPLYEAKDSKLILASDVGLAVVAGILILIGKKFGWANLAVWYFLPYLWVNHWLVAITYLQHTDPSLPHYEDAAWNFARGAAATVDREFGFIGRTLMHGIVETHVLHHFVSTIPFYNADEASEAIKPILGRHYRSNVEGGPWGFIKAMWTSARTCQWVEPSEGAEGLGKSVLFFRNRNGNGVPPGKVTPLES
ncbi:Oleate hydroxylase fah12 [Imshaugia aleurites]|uniref:Oleate hydroxylase fah12 n=1 Tax=Imshaugia aleurites TaxID=172621 RepID=A0A8H3IKF7_9LECA|nr:Oleate hydroxylase fah12 [Imshaugia aleurites]